MKARRGTTGGREAGVTLVEMVVYLFLMGVVAAAVASVMRMFKDLEVTGGGLQASQGEVARFAGRLKRFYYVGSESDLSFAQRVRTSVSTASRRSWRFEYPSWQFEVGNTCSPIPAAHAGEIPTFDKARLEAAMTAQLRGNGDCANAATGAVAGAFRCNNGNVSVFLETTGRQTEFFPPNLRPTAAGGSGSVAYASMPVISVLCRYNSMPAHWDHFVIFMAYLDATQRRVADPWQRLKWVHATIRLPPVLSYSGGVSMLP